MATKNPNSCDFCGKTIEADWMPRCRHWMPFGSAMFLYHPCRECVTKEFGFDEIASACVTRAGYESKAWKQQVDSFIVRYVDRRLADGGMVMKPRSLEALP